jgi:hypothetical protein
VPTRPCQQRFRWMVVAFCCGRLKAVGGSTGHGPDLDPNVLGWVIVDVASATSGSSSVKAHGGFWASLRGNNTRSPGEAVLDMVVVAYSSTGVGRPTSCDVSLIPQLVLATSRGEKTAGENRASATVIACDAGR